MEPKKVIKIYTCPITDDDFINQILSILGDDYIQMHVNYAAASYGPSDNISSDFDKYVVIEYFGYYKKNWRYGLTSPLKEQVEAAYQNIKKSFYEFKKTSDFVESDCERLYNIIVRNAHLTLFKAENGF